MGQQTNKPTPGPWEIGELRDCTNGFPDSLAVIPAGAVGSKRRGNAICLVSASVSATEEDEANARLIAVSPRLYAACKLFLARCRCVDIHRHGFGPAFDAAAAAVREVEGAIEKTEAPA